MTYKTKPNKSSIIRVIISNYDDKCIKEIKVLYTKQGGLDILNIESMSIYDNKVIFDDVRCNSSTVDIEINELRDEIIVKKYDKYSDAILREYKIIGSIIPTKNGGRISTVKIIDLKYEESDRRRKESSTERLLINKELIKNYKYIVGNDRNIDSRLIYKVKRYFSYKSRMLIYFSFINDFFVMNSKDDDGKSKKNCVINGIKEVWKLNEYVNDEFLEKTSFKIYEKIEVFVTNQNNYVKNINKKLKDKKIRGNNYKKETYPTFELNQNLIKEDVKKILIMLTCFRHSLMHYEYNFFEKLMTGEDFSIQYSKKSSELVISDNIKDGYEVVSMSELLNLNILNEISKVKEIKEEKVTNYLEDDYTFRILNKDKNAKKLYNMYYQICNRKNGFNKFINSFFTNDGIENKEFKCLIEEEFNNRREFLDKCIKTKEINGKTLEYKTIENMKKQLEPMNKIYGLVGSPYILDIHQSKKYKRKYNKRKELIEKQSKLISSDKNKINKKMITELNKELYEYKVEMEEITNLNSKFRLNSKLQVAYGFLSEEYGLNLEKFGDKFNSFSDNFLEFKDHGKKYLKSSNSNDFNFNTLERSIKKIKDYDSNFLSNGNILVRFNVLLYLLLPLEIRSEFLGFVKSNYYDVKNVDFISDKLSFNNVEENLDEAKDKFFHSLRLFEKNTKKLGIINYGLNDYFQFNDIIKHVLKKGIQLSLEFAEEDTYSKLYPLSRTNLKVELIFQFNYAFVIILSD